VRRKLIWLVHFLRMFFSAAELQSHAEKLLLKKERDVRQAEYKLALARTVEDRILKEELNRDALRCLLRQEKDSRKIEAMFDLEGEDAELRPLLTDIKFKELFNQAYQNYQLKHFDEAEAAYRKALEIRPHATCWYNLGVLLHELKHYDEAEAALRKVIEIQPDNDWSWNNLGRLLQRLERYDEAEAAYRKALEISPDHAGYWNNLGRLLHWFKRYDEAEAAYRKAIEIAPDYAECWSILSWLLFFDMKKFDKAEYALRKTLDINPDDAVCWIILCSLLERLERFDECEDTLREAINIKPTSSGYDSLAWFLYKRKDKFVEAITFAQKSVELEYDLYAVHTLATLLVANNQWPEAEPHLRALLAKGEEEFFERRWQDMLTLFKEAVCTGRTAEALVLLDESPLAERWRPLREALAAAAEGTSRYLNGVAPEVRQPALEILKTIAPDVLAPYPLQGNA